MIVAATLLLGSTPNSARVTTVVDVAQAITAALKRTILGVLLILIPEVKPSPAATRIAAGPPKSSKTRKMKVSETVTLVLARGIRTEKRELMATVINASRT